MASLLLAIVCATAGVTAGCERRAQRSDQSAHGSSSASSSSGTATPWPSASPPAASGFPRTLRDAFDNPITLKAPPRRIVSQTLGTDEILFAICPHERIIGLSKFSGSSAYSNIVDAAVQSRLPMVVQAEDVLRLKPDLVFIASFSQAEVVELLRAGGAPVVRISNFDRIEDIYGNIRLVARAVGEEAAAERLIADMQRRLDRVRARAAASGRHPTVMSYDTSGYTAGAHTLFDDVIREAGGVNVAATQGVEGFGRVNEEQVLAWNPDYLVCGAKAGEDAIVRRRLLSNPAVAASPVVKAGHLVLMDTRLFLTVSQYVVGAVESLADALYGPEPA